MSDLSLAAAVAGLEIAAVHSAGKLDFFIAYDPEARCFRIMVCRDDRTIADVKAARLTDALIRAEQAVHDADRTAVTA